ncbi:hypothetical protein D3C75_1091280 [compost metagenome]
MALAKSSWLMPSWSAAYLSSAESTASPFFSGRVTAAVWLAVSAAMAGRGSSSALRAATPFWAA